MFKLMLNGQSYTGSSHPAVHIYSLADPSPLPIPLMKCGPIETMARRLDFPAGSPRGIRVKILTHIDTKNREVGHYRKYSTRNMVLNGIHWNTSEIL